MQKKYILIISLLSYVACMATVAIRGGGPELGIDLFVGGAFGILVGLSSTAGGNFAPFMNVAYWLANPIYFLALYFTVVGKTSAASITALMSVGIMLSFLIVLSAPTGGDFVNEAVSIEIGYILWVAASVALLVGNLMLRSRAR